MTTFYGATIDFNRHIFPEIYLKLAEIIHPWTNWLWFSGKLIGNINICVQSLPRGTTNSAICNSRLLDWGDW